MLEESMMGERMTAGEVCSRVPAVTYPGVAVNEAARTMREQHVGCLVVVEEAAQGRRVALGVLTDRDIVTEVVAKDHDPTMVRVADVMSRDLVTAREEDSVADVLALMRRKGVRRIPITGPQEVLVGLVALDDVLGVVAAQLQSLAAAIGSEQKRERLVRP
jgi:CBS domain-containing protein